MLKHSIDSEKDIDRLLRKSVKALGGISIKLVTTHIAGLPDRMCLLPGAQLFFAEIKTTGKKRRKIQVYICSKIERLGFRVEVIDTIDQVHEILTQYIEC